jgi:hypothetical protein
MDLSEVIEAYILRRGGTLSLSLNSLEREVNEYIRLRKTTSYCMIKRSEKPRPKAWTAHHEQIWQDWISMTFDMQSWQSEVVSFFETCDSISELFDYVSEWVQRDVKIVEAFDKTPIEEEAEILYGGLDPYMVEHGMIKGIKHSIAWAPKDLQE